QADKDFGKLKGNWLQKAIGNTNNPAVDDLNNQLQALKNQILELAKAGPSANDTIVKLIEKQKDLKQLAIDTFPQWGQGVTQVKNALTGFLATLNTLEQEYTKTNEVAADKTKALSMQELARKASDAAIAVKDLNE